MVDHAMPYTIPTALTGCDDFMRLYRMTQLGVTDRERAHLDRVVSCAFELGSLGGMLAQLMREIDSSAELERIAAVAHAIGHVSQCANVVGVELEWEH